MGMPARRIPNAFQQRIDMVGIDTLRVYKIRIESHLTERWSDWFEGLAICNDPNGSA